MESIQAINDFKTQNKHVNYLYDTVENRVEDAFDLTHLLQNKTTTKLVVYFDKFPVNIRKGVKYWIEDELLIKNTSPDSARSLTLFAGNAFSYLQMFCGPIDSLEDIQEEQFDSYMAHLEDRVRNQGTLELKSAYSYAISFMKFLRFLQNEDIAKYPYLSKKNISKLFPFEYPEKFFSGDALKEHLSIKQKKKESRPLDYFHLVEILENLQDYDDVLFNNISIIMAHTGLRLTEVLHLETDCLENVTKEEEEAAEYNRIPIDGKEDLYWLSNYKTIKGKQKKWVQGTPILVGSEVKEAVNLLTAHSKALLKKYEKALEGSSNRICLIVHHGSVKIITSSGYNSKRKAFISKTGIKYFTAHQFRHTYASMLYDSGVPIEYIRKYLNHIHEDMTGGYIKKDKQRSMQKYESFASAKVFAGGGSKKAYDFQGKIKEAFEHPEFGAMAIEERTQFLEMLSDSMDMDIHAMDHGMCLIPKGTACPNNFIEINSCFEQNCGQFATTETSIPHFTRMIKYKKEWIKDFENTGHLAAAKKGKSDLEKSINILEKLKKGEYFDK